MKYVNLGGQWYSKKAVKEIKKKGNKADVVNNLFLSQYVILQACVVTRQEVEKNG